MKWSDEAVKTATIFLDKAWNIKIPNSVMRVALDVAAEAQGIDDIRRDENEECANLAEKLVILCEDGLFRPPTQHAIAVSIRARMEKK